MTNFCVLHFTIPEFKINLTTEADFYNLFDELLNLLLNNLDIALVSVYI